MSVLRPFRTEHRMHWNGSMRKACTVLLLGVVLGITSSACAAAPEVEEEQEDSSSAIVAGSLACRLASSATAHGVRVTARSGAVTAGCVAVAWAGAGVAEAGCLAPAGVTALSAIFTAFSAGVAWLTCDGGVAMKVTLAQTSVSSTPAKVSACETEALAKGCDIEKCKDLYALQKDLCRDGGACLGNHVTKVGEDICGTVERVMKGSRNCVNARRNVQKCFAKPDFGGHQTQINQLCTVFRGCERLGAMCESEGHIQVPLLPTPCEF
jgi:hypothetical protein